MEHSITAAVPEKLLAAFLARMERGETPDLDALMRAHPEHAVELRELYEEES